MSAFLVKVDVRTRSNDVGYGPIAALKKAFLFRSDQLEIGLFQRPGYGESNDQAPKGGAD